MIVSGHKYPQTLLTLSNAVKLCLPHELALLGHRYTAQSVCQVAVHRRPNGNL